jgi:CheY-like chemotaxis protein
VVDDVATDCELIGKVVTATGNHPEFAADGDEAVQKARAWPPP